MSETNDVVNAIIESFSGWDGDQYECFTLYDAKFATDFGPFKKDETVKCIQFSFAGGALEECNSDGVGRSCKIKLVAV
jgi:hypothetical protein